jgi:hypothetical protein
MKDAQITIAIFNKMALAGIPFSIKQLNEEAIKNGGIARIDLVYPTKDYVADMLKDGFLQIADTSGKETLYRASEKLLFILKANPNLAEKGLRADAFMILAEMVATGLRYA